MNEKVYDILFTCCPNHKPICYILYSKQTHKQDFCLSTDLFRLACSFNQYSFQKYDIYACPKYYKTTLYSQTFIAVSLHTLIADSIDGKIVFEITELLFYLCQTFTMITYLQLYGNHLHPTHLAVPSKYPTHAYLIQVQQLTGILLWYVGDRHC